MKFPKVKVKTEYVRLFGGLDLESPSLAIDPGSLISGVNYMAGSEGGYARIDGYERYSGQTSPSDGTYYYCPCTFTDSGPAVGNEVEGAVSGATGEVVSIGTAYITITKVVGTFNNDEDYEVSAVTKGTFTGDLVEKGESTPLLHATVLNATADVYRADISPPGGSGPIRGLALLNGTLYCFMNNSGGTAGIIYKETSSGWTEVTLGNEITFTTGVGTIAEGDTITGTVTGTTAVVARVVLTSGEWETDAAGKLIIGAETGAGFDGTETLEVTGIEATSTSVAVAISITVGGTYECIIHNFTGSTATKRIYGCDGVNRGFEFDGTTYVPIDTGMTVDTPNHVTAYKKQLFFSFKGSSQNSGVGTPYVWSAVLGAGEIALGDDIVGYSPEAKSLNIFSRNSTNQLLGSSVSDFELENISDETGAIPYTIQEVGTALCLDDRGLIEIKRVQEYGNFDMATVSRRVQKRMNTIRASANCSSVYRSKNQYRVYGGTGTGICVTLSILEKGLYYSFTEFKYPDTIVCAVSGEDSTGKDVVFLGTADGQVFQADKGSSFDGDEIEAYCFLPFHHSKSPSVIKTYRYGTFEMTTENYSPIQFNVMFSYGNSDIQEHPVTEFGIEGDSAQWDVSTWDSFFYDNEIVSAPNFNIAGDGTNMSLSIYCKSDIDLGHKLDGLIFHYTPRRLVR